MLPDASPQRIDTVLHHLEAAQLRALIQHLPDPYAAAREMVGPGWITKDQFSSLFPVPGQRPTPRKPQPIGFGEETRPDAGGSDWSLTLSDEEMRPGPVTVKAAPMLSGAANTPPFAWDVPAPHAIGGNEARRRESETDRRPRPRMGWASKGLLMAPLFLGSLFVTLPIFQASSAIGRVAHPEARQASAGDPVRAVVLPPAPPIVPLNNAKQRDDLLDGTGRNVQPVAPAAVRPEAPRAAEPPIAPAPPARATARPRPKASLYERIRQVVLENKTEETQRIGIGDIAYQNVPEDGSIMVGMAVTYAPFINHNIIKSVRPIYQRPDGTRYDGPICGNPTQVGERVLAKEGYAIGGVAISAGLAIDGMQLTFMEIGADGLNPKKTYLSKWLGAYGGSRALMQLNDGRPIIGIAGMRSSNTSGPLFCMCLVTTQVGALADADAPSSQSPGIYGAKQR